MATEKLLSIGEQIRLGRETLPGVDNIIRDMAYFLGQAQEEQGLLPDPVANWCIAEGIVCLERARDILK